MAESNRRKPATGGPAPLVAEWFDRGREGLETIRLIRGLMDQKLH